MDSHLDRKLSVVMSRLMQRILILDRNEKMCYGVTLAQHHVIDTLYRKNKLPMNELSKEQGLAISTLTRIIDVLVRDEIVERVANPNDRRKVCVQLTEKGLALAEKLKACTQKFWSNVLDFIPEEKKSGVVDNVKILLEVLERVHETCCQMKS